MSKPIKHVFLKTKVEMPKGVVLTKKQFQDMLESGYLKEVDGKWLYPPLNVHVIEGG